MAADTDAGLGSGQGQSKRKRSRGSKGPKNSISGTPKAKTDQVPKEMKDMIQKYTRGSKTSGNNKLKRFLKQRDELADKAAEAAAMLEMLKPDEKGYIVAEKGEKPTKLLTQDDLKLHLDYSNAKSIWNFVAQDGLGPYKVKYSTNGVTLGMVGAKGHAAIMNMNKKAIVAEYQHKETIRDFTFCHDDRFLVVAQKKYCYMYTNKWEEVHKMDKHTWPNRVEFLRHHLLVASVGKLGNIVWQDISTGKVAGEQKTRRGPCDTMCQNPWNGVVFTADRTGYMALWNPTAKGYLALLRGNNCAITGMAIDISGKYMVTTAVDSSVKVWDLRMFKEMQKYHTNTAINDVQISQTGVVGFAKEDRVEFFKHMFNARVHEPYMVHKSPTGHPAINFSFAAFQDTVAVGFSNAVSQIVVPGSGEANIDSNLPNPMESRTAKKERPVRLLLEKLAPQSIQLDPEAIGILADKSKTMKERSAFRNRQLAHMYKDEGKDEMQLDEDEKASSGDDVSSVDEDGKKKKKRRKSKTPKAPNVKQLHSHWEGMQAAKRKDVERLKAKRERESMAGGVNFASDDSGAGSGGSDDDGGLAPFYEAAKRKDRLKKHKIEEAKKRKIRS